MKCLIGIYHKTSGTIIFKGKEVDFKGPLEALNSGISMIHQELSPVPERSVAENVWLGRQPMKNAFMVDHKKMREDTIELFKQMDLDIDPDEKMGNLTVAQMQMVEICKAVSYNPAIMVLDEPTSSLDPDTERELLGRLGKHVKNKTLIIITHRESVSSLCMETVHFTLNNHKTKTYDNRLFESQHRKTES